MDGLTSGQHLDKLSNSPGASFRFLSASDPVEDGVSIRTCKALKHRRRTWISAQSSRKIFGNLHARLPGVGGLPSSVHLRLPHLVFAGLMHSAGGDQPLSDGSVALRPRTANLS